MYFIKRSWGKHEKSVKPLPKSRLDNLNNPFFPPKNIQFCCNWKSPFLWYDVAAVSHLPILYKYNMYIHVSVIPKDFEVWIRWFCYRFSGGKSSPRPRPSVSSSGTKVLGTESFPSSEASRVIFSDPTGNDTLTHRIHVCNYGRFTYIYHKDQPNVGKYTIHGWYGLCSLLPSKLVVLRWVKREEPERVYTVWLEHLGICISTHAPSSQGVN